MNRRISDQALTLAINALEGMIQTQGRLHGGPGERRTARSIPEIVPLVEAAQELADYRRAIRAASTVTEPEWKPI